MMSKPAKTDFIDLAKRAGEFGREDCQEGWHKLAALLIPPPMTILDVGAGLGLSKERLGRDRTATLDPAPLACVDFSEPVSEVGTESFDAVTCFDVIEHVVEDVDFLSELMRVARKNVFITTPNLNVSHAANGCHCREYSPRELVALVEALPNCDYSWWIGDGPGDYRRIVGRSLFLDHFHAHHGVLIHKKAAGL